jgi:small-conductance mechanosensitive channel
LSNFEFVFSLFGLLLGLALAQLLSGFGRALQTRHKIRVGWLTPMLGLIVSLDVTSFWQFAWQVRGSLAPDFFILICCFAITGLYYLVARIVFPDEPTEWPDYDAYFFRHKKIVLGGVLACNLLAYFGQYALGFNALASHMMVIVAAVFFPLVILSIFARGRLWNTVALGLLLAQYPVLSFYSMSINAG